VFPPALMKKIEKSQVKPITKMEGNKKDVSWFCIQSIEERTTKNGKIFYRLKVCDSSSESVWLRVWGRFNQLPDLYTIWLAEVASSEAWGCSTSAYKMKQINV